MKQPLKIPFDGHGNQVHYSGEIGIVPDELKYEADEPEGKRRFRNEWITKARDGRTWKDNFEFDAHLAFVGMSRGRSAAYFHLRSAEGNTYTMFMSDILDLLQRGRVIEGACYGRWTFVKKGSNYGVKLIHSLL